MILDIVLFVLGAVLAILTLRDVFQTVVVPGGSHAFLQVGRRVLFALLPLWKHARGRRRGLSDSFAPLALVLAFIIWMCLLAIGFGLMVFAVRAEFRPALSGFGDAVYLVGSTLATVGLSQSHPFGVARWVIMAAGFCGLAVMTLAVTYLLEVQSSISKRDIGIIKLNTSAGNPPSALSLLERFADLRQRQALPEVLTESRNWCATVRQSHTSHPSLVYFQSVSTGAGWPAALGAIMDAALLAEHCIDDDDLYGPAVLLRNEGLRMARDLAFMAHIKPQQVGDDTAELKQACNRLGTSGYPLRKDADFGVLTAQRAEYRAYVDGLADHLGKPTAVLVRQG